MKRNTVGSWGEQQAKNYLINQGYRIIEANYHCRYGEIDLIAEKDSIIAFVEVKTRKNRNFAEAREFVTFSKREKLRATAAMWLSEHDADIQTRFDVVEVYTPQGTDTAHPAIHHWEEAFE